MLNTLNVMNIKLMLLRKEFFLTLLISLLFFMVPALVTIINLYNTDLATLAPAWCYFGVINPFPNNLFAHSVQIYFMLFFPFLVSTAYSYCIFDNKQTGLNKSILARVDKNKYYISSAIVVFLGGFLIVFIPLVLSQLLMIVAIPLNSLKVSPGYPLDPDLTFSYVSFFERLCYQYPYLYFFTYNFITGIFGGLQGLLSFSVSLHFKINRFLTIMLPGIVYIAASYLLNMISLHHLSLNYLVVPPTTEEGIQLIYVVGFAILLFFINFIALLVKLCVKRDEL